MDDTKPFWQTHADLAVQFSAASSGDATDQVQSPGGGPPRSTYLESSQRHCDKHRREVISEQQEIRSVGCRAWFCPHCCIGKGLALKRRLMPVVATFKRAIMWTMTVDPKLFGSPLEAYEYLRDERCVSRLVRELRRRGLLASDRYFCVVEWQSKTEMPHFHLLVDAEFIPFDDVCEIWNRFRPERCGPIEGDRPGFGSVRFSAPRFRSAAHAVHYACKYLIKFPKHGYPDWVVSASARSVHRYSTSRGFWGDSVDEPEDSSKEVPVDDLDATGEDVESVVRPTIRSRVERCGEKSVVLRVVEAVDLDTGEVVTSRRFVGKLAVPLAVAAAALGVAAEPLCSRVEISWAMADQALRRFCYGYDPRAFEVILPAAA